ncbi:MAG: class I adenylate-forming enzyme family protein [Proteobacteria bacterium]|nr:class I adenylate-forming enzyme family protein [Pseudomonadota bacterium]
MSAEQILELEFGVITELIHSHALENPAHRALVEGSQVIDYAALDAWMDRIACALQREGLKPGDAIAICASMSIAYAAVFLGALRAGVVVAPLAPGSTTASLVRMIADAQARVLFVDAAAAEALDGVNAEGIPLVMLDNSKAGRPLEDWLPATGAQPAAVTIDPSWAFNIIYSSGTTGEPKGIVQPHAMRWSHVRRGKAYGYGPDTVTLLSTPLYSNTTLVVLFPTLTFGGTVVLMPKFNAETYLQLAQTRRVTHTMLVPVQYQRLMARPDFDSYDLSSFKIKFSTSAPFSAALKADVLKRWPGGLVEFYGMTEGGGTCILDAHLHPGKLHTVGRPAEGHDIRLIDDNGTEVAPGEAGEVVGHSAGMMSGYHGQPEKTRAAEWFDPTGKRFIRTGDIGRFDGDGFLTLFDRKKDMIISGGFNIYPSDLEAVLREHPAVEDAAVVGVPSVEWGETPVAFVIRKAGVDAQAEALLQWVKQRVGRTQRLASVRFLEELPRSPIGKVLKRELRDRYEADAAD